MMLRDLVFRLRALVRPAQAERDLDDELAFHMERETEKLVASGMSRVDARLRALSRFGSRLVVADECRDVRGTGAVEDLGRDLVYAWRTFRRGRLAVVTIVVTMTLGLGMVTTAFSIFNALFLRVDAVQEPAHLYELRRPLNSRAWMPFTQAEYRSLQSTTSVFTGLTAMNVRLSVRSNGRLLRGAMVAGNFFDVLGVNPTLGRTLTPLDDQTGGSPVVVLSDSGWARLFDHDPEVVGHRIRLNGVDTEIVGVMPAAFFGLDAAAPDFWAPLADVGRFRPGDAGREETLSLSLVGRLRHDVTVDAARGALQIWAAGPGMRRAGRSGPVTIVLRPATGVTAEVLDALPAFGAILTAFGLILLIGCANVANLLLARGLTRGHEIGIRLSLGAPRRRIVRQLLTENFVLALAATVCAYPLARVIMTTVVSAIAAYSPPEMGEQLNVTIPTFDWHVLLFLAISAMVATASFGVIPALQAARVEPMRMMQGEFGRAMPRSRARYVLVAGQVAASAILLIAAATFLRSAYIAARVDPALRIDSAIVVNVANESRRSALLQAIAGDADVTRIAAASRASEYRTTVAEAASTRIRSGFLYRLASPDFFEVIGIPLVRGRGFATSERSAAASVILVSERAATRLWPDQDPIGQLVRLSLESGSVRALTVIGVVHTPVLPVRDSGLDADLYVAADLDTPGIELNLRVRDDPFRARAYLLERLTAVDPALGPVTTLHTVVGATAFAMRALFAIGLALGVLALILTVSGLFSVLSYVVEQRSKEFGVRMALGASAPRVMHLVFVESGIPVGIGLLAGVLLAAAISGALSASPLAEEIGTVVRTFDPAAYGASLLIIVLACSIAVSFPALRALRIDPSAILRKD
jgi:predicted permease